VERLDVHRHDLPVLPLHRRRLDGVFFSRRLAEGADRGRLLLHTLRRAAIIFGLGLALNTLSFFLFHRAQVRIPGVLQRIGVCFFFAALIYLLFGPRGLLPAAAVLLAVYWALMTFVPVPGYGPGNSTSRGTSPRTSTARSSAPHLEAQSRLGPRGPALDALRDRGRRFSASSRGEWLRSKPRLEPKLAASRREARPPSRSASSGHVLPDQQEPLDVSYSLLMSGLAAVCLALCICVVDPEGLEGLVGALPVAGHERDRALRPLERSEPCFFCGSSSRARTARRRSLYGTIYRSVFDHFADARIGSFLFALTWCALLTAVAGVLYRNRIFVKV
jgi:predicted acyltransferase